MGGRWPGEDGRPWGRMFFHDEASFRGLWRRVAEETGVPWRVDVALVGLEEWGMEREDYEWMGGTSRGLNFVAWRLDADISEG